MDKKQRNYSLRIEDNTRSEPPEYVTIDPPFTLEFEIVRNSLVSSNVCHFRIFNLAEQTRNRLTQDKYDWSAIKFREVVLRAGYGNSIQGFPILFRGDISRCWSHREGPDFITSIDCMDRSYAFINAHTSQNFSQGQTMNTVVGALIGALVPFGIQPGAVGNVEGTLSRGNSLTGNPIQILNELTNGTFFIDNSLANVLNQNDAIDELIVINSQTGLLNTPIREQQYVNFEIIFEPRIRVGQMIRLQSTTNKSLTGDYVVVSVAHKGMISDAVCGNAITQIGARFGSNFNRILPAVYT